jgi:hypothetical protein
MICDERRNTATPEAKMTDPRFCDGANDRVFSGGQKTLQRDGIHRGKVRVRPENVRAFL